MKWPAADTMSRRAAALFVFIAFLWTCEAVQEKINPERESISDHVDQALILGMLYSCALPNAIRFGTTLICGNVPVKGMIYDRVSKTFINTDETTGSPELECWITSSGASAVTWWTTEERNPPSGATATLVFQSDLIIENGKYVGVTPFTSYPRGKPVYCADIQGFAFPPSYRYQKLIIN